MSKNYSVKPRKSGVGKLFLGIFLGFLLCIGLIAGVGFFAYKNLSIDWINNTFKTDIDSGSEELNKKTIEDLVMSAVGLAQNSDTYTLNNLKDDFGISVSDKLMGIDISNLKDVPLNDISTKVQNLFSNISAEELKDVINLKDMNSILNKTNTYFVSGTTLYEDASHNKAVDKEVIDYKISGDQVIIKDVERTIDNGEVEFELRYLPLTTALGDFMSTMGDKITVGELTDKEKGFGVELPEYLCDTAEKKAKTINELEGLVNSLYLADFLGYTISGETVTNDLDGEPVTGIVAKLAKKTVAELSGENGIKNIIDTSTIAEIMGYYEKGGVYYTDAEYQNPVTGIMKAAAGKTVNNLSSIVDELYLTDVFSSTDFESGVLSWIESPETVKVKEITDALIDAISDKTLEDLKGAGLITENVDIKIENTNTIHDGKNLKDLTIDEVIIVLTDVLESLKSTNP